MHTTAGVREGEGGARSPLHAYGNPAGLFFTQHGFMQKPHMGSQVHGERGMVT